MFLHSLFRAIRSHAARGRGGPSRRRHAALRPVKPCRVPLLEPLEDRLAPALLVVNTLADDTSPDQTLSLREAIHVVNTQTTAGLSAAEKAQITGVLGSNDTIKFGNLTGTITLTNPAGQLELTRDVDIEGPGANLLSVSGNHTTRVFFVGNVIATLANLTITAGQATQGAGIDNAGDLSVSGCSLTANHALGAVGGDGVGGGILNELGATLTLTGSQLSGNAALGGTATGKVAPRGVGGGLANEGSADVIGTVFMNNNAFGATGTSGGNGGAAYGGGIANMGSLSGLEVEGGSALDDNSAFGGTAGTGGQGGGAFGGGLANGVTLLGLNTGGVRSIDVRDSGLSGNKAMGGGPGGGGTAGGAAEGGGIYNDGQIGVENSTLESNQALAGLAAQGLGGGISNLGTAHITGGQLSDNHAVGGNSFATSAAGAGEGGAIANIQPGAPITSLTIYNGCRILNNTARGGDSTSATTNGADGVGGGIANEGGSVFVGGPFVFRNGILTGAPSLIQGNQAVGGAGPTGGRGVGGGIANRAGGQVEVLASALVGNIAQGGTGGTVSGGTLGGGRGGDGLGGGIATDGAVTFVGGSVVGANVAAGGDDNASGGKGGDGLGGGLYIDPAGAAVTFFATITGNQALGGHGSPDGSGVGGGVYSLGAFSPLLTFVFGNIASTSHNDLGP